MQTRFLSFIGLALCAATIFSSCSKSSNKEGRYVPKNAAIVFHLNGESLNSKLPWEDIKKNQLFQDASSDTAVTAYMKTILDNPENSGIDIKKDLIFFLQKDSSGGYFAVEGTVKDAAKFKQFTTEATKVSAETEKDGIHYVADKKVTSSWNKDRFILIFDVPEMNEMSRMNAMQAMDDTAATMPSVTVYRDGKAVAASLYTLAEDASLAKDAKFSDLMATKGDIHFWMNAESFGNMMGNNPALAMVSLNKLYEGAITTATASFDNGVINIDTKSYSGKDLTTIWKKYKGDKINADMVKNIPTKNVAGFFAMNFKPEGIMELAKLLKVDGFANMGAAYVGFTFEDFIKANKGDILFSVTDVRKDSFGSPSANYLFSASIGDKAAFAKLVDAGKKLGGQMGSSADVAYNSNDKIFAIGNAKTVVDQYIAGTAKTDFDFFDKISGSPMGGYINFQYIFGAIKPSPADSLQYAAVEASAKMWDNAIFKGGDFEKDAVTQHIEINLMDKSTNSLKQLNTYFGVIGAIQKKTEAAYSRNWDSDAIMAMPDTTVVTEVAP